MEDNLIERLDKEITQQTRNGRNEVYIQVEDLNKLGYSISTQKTGRIYVDVEYLRIAMKRYAFKQGLKVDTTGIYEKPKTYREFIREIKNKERDD
jgi:hypothetical protein